MQHFTADALILRSVERGEHDRLITVLTADFGRFYAIVKGAGSIHRREVAATEPYTWSNIEFYEKNGVKWVKNAASKESFAGLRYDMDKLFLAAYIAEVAGELSDEREPAGEILPLALNTLHTLANTAGENDRIKAAFELRAACVAGFTPDLTLCGDCHAPVAGDGYLDVMNGSFTCAKCLSKRTALLPLSEIDELGERTLLCPLSAGSAAAIAYVATAPAKRIFAFRVTDARERAEFARACEAYLLHHLERGFASLENYKKMEALIPKKEGI